MPDSLSIWLEKKQFLESQLALAFDASEKFKLHKDIEECESKISEYSIYSSSDNILDLYFDYLKNRCSKIKILNMDKPIDLGKHYTKINVLHKITARTKNKIELLENQLKAKGHFGKIINTRPIIELLAEKDVESGKYNNILILGKPGAGKTTLLKYIALEGLLGERGQLKRETLPILIELRELSQSNELLMDFLQKQFDICGVLNTNKLVKTLLNSGKCLLLLDGLDEVKEQKIDNILIQITDLVNKYNKNQFIITCRIGAYNYVFQEFKDTEIADFDDEQIRNFVLDWFYSDKNKYKSFLENLQKNKSIKELASTPLLLTLMCLDYDETTSFPSNRSELYQQCIYTLLKKWDETRRIQRDEPYKILSVDMKQKLFAYIANKMMISEKHFLPEETLTILIEEFIKIFHNDNWQGSDFNARQIIKSIEAQHGIFVERTENIYSFSHLTFQEYFTAKHIIYNIDSQSIKKLIIEQFTNTSTSWKEIFLLTASMLTKADEFFRLMEEKTKLMKTDELTYFLERLFSSDEFYCIIKQIKQNTKNLSEGAICAIKLLICLNTASEIAFKLISSFNSIYDYSQNLHNALFRAKTTAYDKIRKRIHIIGRSSAKARAFTTAVEKANNMVKDIKKISDLLNDIDFEITLASNRALSITTAYFQIYNTDFSNIFDDNFICNILFDSLPADANELLNILKNNYDNLFDKELDEVLTKIVASPYQPISIIIKLNKILKLIKEINVYIFCKSRIIECFCATNFTNKEIYNQIFNTWL